MVKVELLNDGDFGGLKNVVFPCVVEAEYVLGDSGPRYEVSSSELVRVGASKAVFNVSDETFPWLVDKGEVRLVTDTPDA